MSTIFETLRDELSAHKRKEKEMEEIKHRMDIRYIYVKNAAMEIDTMKFTVSMDSEELAIKDIRNVDPRLDPRPIIECHKEHPISSPCVAYANGKTLVTLYKVTMLNILTEENKNAAALLDGFIYSIDAVKVNTAYDPNKGCAAVVTYTAPTNGVKPKHKILAYKDRVVVLSIGNGGKGTIVKCDNYIIYERNEIKD